MLSITFRAMGCQIAAFLDRDDDHAVHLLEQVPSWFEEWEQVLSRFRPDSDLNRLNDSAGRPAKVGPVLWEVIEASRHAACATGGLVNPLLLKPLEQAGYTRSFELLDRDLIPDTGLAMPTLPSSALDAAGRTASIHGRGSPLNSNLHAWRSIRVKTRRGKTRYEVTLPAGFKMDLGGVAKGWAAQRAATVLNGLGPALVDAGGDIAVSRARANGKPWPVDIADPLNTQPNLGMLALTRGGVATSGIDYRRWLRDGAWKHHIIDPRTGQPAENDLLSVTAIAPDLLEAEAAAKAVMVLGSRPGLNWLAAHPQIAALLVLQDGRLIASNEWKAYEWRDDGNQS